MAPAMSAWRAHSTQLISITTYSSSYKLMICCQYVMLCQLTGYNMFENVMICCVVRYFNIFQLNIQYLPRNIFQRANQNLTQRSQKKKNCVQSASVAWVISKDAFSSQDRLNMAWHASWNLWEIYEICLRKLWHYENMFESSGMEDSQDNIIIYHASYLGLSATSDTSTSAICNQISACRSPSAVQCVQCHAFQHVPAMFRLKKRPVMSFT